MSSGNSAVYSRGHDGREGGNIYTADRGVYAPKSPSSSLSLRACNAIYRTVHLNACPYTLAGKCLGVYILKRGYGNLNYSSEGYCRLENKESFVNITGIILRDEYTYFHISNRYLVRKCRTG